MNHTRAGRVVVGVADTLAGYEALRFAVDLARQRELPLVAVRSFTYSASESWEWRIAMGEQAQAEVASAFVEALGAVPADLDVHVVAEPGPAGRLLAQTADRPDDVLVVGGPRRRRTLWWRPAAATVSLCCRLAVCPVTVVPEPALARTGSIHHLGRGVAHDVERFLRAHSPSV